MADSSNVNTELETGSDKRVTVRSGRTGCQPGKWRLLLGKCAVGAAGLRWLGSDAEEPAVLGLLPTEPHPHEHGHASLERKERAGLALLVLLMLVMLLQLVSCRLARRAARRGAPAAVGPVKFCPAEPSLTKLPKTRRLLLSTRRHALMDTRPLQLAAPLVVVPSPAGRIVLSPAGRAAAEVVAERV